MGRASCISRYQCQEEQIQFKQQKHGKKAKGKKIEEFLNLEFLKQDVQVILQISKQAASLHKEKYAPFSPGIVHVYIQRIWESRFWSNLLFADGIDLAQEGKFSQWVFYGRNEN